MKTFKSFIFLFIVSLSTLSADISGIVNNIEIKADWCQRTCSLEIVVDLENENQHSFFVDTDFNTLTETKIAIEDALVVSNETVGNTLFQSLFILKFENGETFQAKGRSIELQREDFGLITENHFMIVSAVEKPSHSNENMTFLVTLDNDHQLSLEHVPLGYSSDDLVGTVVERVDEYFVYDNPGYSIFTYRIEELGI